MGTAQAAPPQLVAKDFSKPAIVILGYGLKPDGTSEDRDAGLMSLAPSRTRTPRYWRSPSELWQIATRELAVLPKTTTVLGGVHRAVELRYP